MRILITGGAGFIGSHVADAYLRAGHEVAVVDDLSTGARENLEPQVRFWQADIRSPELPRILADFRPEMVSHHAAQMSVAASVRDPRGDADINILGTLDLLEAAVRHGVRRVIFASTGGAMYGEQETLPTPETVCPEPVSPYGVAKLAVERYLHAFQAMHGLEAIALRYANVYGPRQNPHGEAGVVAIFSRAILEGRKLTVNGNGEQTRDYVYVGDVVRANLLGTEVALGTKVPILNIGTGVETSVNNLVRLLEQIAGGGIPRRHGPSRPGEQRRSALDARRAKQFLGWEPATEIREGLAQTFHWFRERFSG
ncbi:MAG TPA: NAD-dependent epimerase/dehydratase family protein [Candidatus Methylomirabilis sp.]|nr:NAD-dependent epimerase/dehydratase family protein [Candidatus Methylomirabilis sp.]HSB80577.1 NAD-dependent epimerase/dehydratase family protein [Candidatus Methylomirabilis sp.]